ncbi:MAG: hypothetical protein WED07_13490 [Candidatus Freyarchaeum deiterrae]
MEPRTKAILRGLILGIIVFMILMIVPLLIYNFATGLIRDVFILYTFGPPQYQNWISSLSAPALPLVYINFGTIYLLGLPISLAVFFWGLFKSETVGRALSGLTLVLLGALWFLVGFGSLGVTTTLLFSQIPLIAIDPTAIPPIVITYLSYTAPLIVNIQGVINLVIVIILLNGLVYVVEFGIGAKNKDYWRYWGK